MSLLVNDLLHFEHLNPDLQIADLGHSESKEHKCSSSQNICLKISRNGLDIQVYARWPFSYQWFVANRARKHLGF